MTHIARHRILRLLGAGTAAEVFEVLTPEGERRALKLARAEGAEPEEHQLRLAQEGEAVAMIEHVNVVRFYDAGIEEGRVWLLLELVEGPDLRSLVERSGDALPLPRALRLVRQACEGVAEAHALGILHRDLKPENILVGEGDLAKVADFGSAKLAGWGVKTTGDQERSSALYTAPEYMLRRVATPASDVYAMALVLYELVAGTHPMGSRALPPIEICRRQLNHDPPPLASLGRDLPGDLSDLVQQALSKDPALRPSMRAFADALAVVLRRLQVPQRAVARGLALPRKELGLARTEPVSAVVGPSGTMAMPAFKEVAVVGEEVGRRAVLPPAPLEEVPPRSVLSAPVSLAGGALTLRSASAVGGGRGSSPEGGVGVGVGGERGSTHAPVERVGSRPSRVTGAGVLVGAILGAVGAVGVVVALGLAGGWWGAVDVQRVAPAGGGVGVAGSASAAASSGKVGPSVTAAASGSARALGGKGPPARR